jgi:hypothetical protein
VPVSEWTYQDEKCAGARSGATAQNQFGVPIMQSLKRCACIWPI